MSKKAYDLVLEVLEEYPETRNSDRLLMYYVYSMQVHGYIAGELKLYRSKMMSDGYIHPKTIIESRRKIQREQEKEWEENGYITGTPVLADKKYRELRAKLAEEKGTHVYREKVKQISCDQCGSKPCSCGFSDTQLDMNIRDSIRYDNDY